MIRNKLKSRIWQSAFALSVLGVPVPLAAQSAGASALELQMRAEEASRQQQWPKSYKLLSQALNQDPTNKRLTLQTARSARLAGETEAARRLLLQSVDYDAEARKELAYLEMDEANWQAARDQLEIYVVDSEVKAEGNFMLAFVQFHLEDYEAAYKAALKAGSEDQDLRAPAFLLAAEAKYRLGDENLPRKASKKAAQEAGREYIKNRAQELLAFLDPKKEVQAPYWMYWDIASQYNTNKLNAPKTDLSNYEATVADQNVFKGLELFVSLAGAYTIDADAVLLEIGGAINQKAYGFGEASGTIGTAGASLELTSPASGTYALWFDTSSLIHKKSVTLMPSLELGAQFQTPGFTSVLSSIVATPRLTLFTNANASYVIAIPIVKAFDSNAATSQLSHLRLAGVLQASWAKESWRFVDGQLSFGSYKGTDDPQQSYLYAIARFSSRFDWSGFFLDDSLQFENRMFTQANTQAQILTANLGFGYTMDQRKFFIGPYVQFEQRFGTGESQQILGGIRLGGAL